MGVLLRVDQLGLGPAHSPHKLLLCGGPTEAHRGILFFEFPVELPSFVLLCVGSTGGEMAVLPPAIERPDERLN